MSSKHRVVVLKILSGEFSVTAAAAKYGMSRQYLDKLLARYRDEGLDGLSTRSRAPLTSPQKTTDRVRDRGTTPATAYAASPKALPAGARPDAIHYRIRHDHVGNNGKISLRRAGRMHHLGIGTDHRGTPVLLIADDTTVTVVHQRTGEIIATNTINPAKTYWRNTQKEPGRWPGSPT